MYKFYCDETLFYMSGVDDSDFYILNANLSLEEGKAGALSFTLPHTNVIYDYINKLSSIITVYDNDEEIFRGRVLYDEKDFYNRRVITCEGELAFLLDSIMRPYEHKGTINDFFSCLIENHNEQVESKKRFTVGNITVTDNNNYINRSGTEYDNTFNVINDKLVKTYGGYLKTRGADGVRYIDYLEEYGEVNEQVIEFGVNLLDIKEHITAENIFTCLIPLGKKDDSTGKRLTIESINGVDYLENQTAIDLFGRIYAVKTWDDVTVATNLKNKGKEYLDANIEMAVTLTLKALDLHNLNVNTSRIKEGDKVRVISIPHKLDKHFKCTKIKIDFLNPENNEYTFGSTYKTLTDPVTNDKMVTMVEDAVTKVTAETQKEIVEIKETLTQEELLNLITNNGKVEGIYLIDGQIWVNGTYIEANSITTNQLSSEVGKKLDLSSNESIKLLVEKTVEKNIDDFRDVVISETAPDDNTLLWLDTSVEPNILKNYNGEQWIATNDQSNDIQDAIDDTKKKITTDYTSALEQTSKNLSIAITELEKITNSNTESITSVQTSLDITSELAQFTKTTLEQVQSAVDGKVSVNEIREWARFDGAKLELGTSDSKFKAILTNTELGFYQGAEKVAWVSNNEFHCKVIRAEKEISIHELSIQHIAGVGYVCK